MKVLATLPKGYSQFYSGGFNMVADSLNNKLHLFKVSYENDRKIYLDGQILSSTDTTLAVGNFNHYIIDLNKLEQ